VKLEGSPISLDVEKAVPLLDIASNQEALNVIQNQDRIRLNIGCDRTQIAGFLGVDFNPDVDPDVLAEADNLPYEDNTVDEIYASHVLEHLPYGNTALQEWFRVLKPGGMVTVMVPDINEVYTLSKHNGVWGPYSQPVDELYINAVAFGASMLAEVIPEMKPLYGGPGHVHKQIFIGGMLLKRVFDAGFLDAHESSQTILGDPGIGNRIVVAHKPIEGEDNG
jgi:SAM-dependent methyltransferase